MAKITLEQFREASPNTAFAVADLLAAVDAVKPPQKAGWRGVMVAKFQGWGIPDHVRHAFTDAVWGIWSSNDLQPEECRGISQWLDDGGHKLVAAIVSGAETARALEDGVVQAGLELGAEATIQKGDVDMTQETPSIPQNAPQGPQEAVGTPQQGDAIVHDIQGADTPLERNWTQDAQRVTKFFAWAQNTQGLSIPQTLQVLGIKAITDFDGTDADALHAIKAKATDEPTPSSAQEPTKLPEIIGIDWPEPPKHIEATVIAWAHMLDPQGVDWSLTLREGGDPALLVEVAKACASVSAVLLREGWRTVDGATRISPQTVRKAATAQPGAPKQASQPAAHASDVRHAIHAVKFVTSATQSGKPTVEFFAAGHRYRDLTWGLSGENQTVGQRIMAEFPALVNEGWGVADFDAPRGTEHKCDFIVRYALSEKLNERGNPYKDITSIELRQTEESVHY